MRRPTDVRELVALVEALPREALPMVLAAVLARMMEMPVAPAVAPSPSGREPERWLSVAQVAERLGRDRRWVYRRAISWPFTVKDGKSLMFSERGLQAYMEHHRINGDS